MEKGRPDERFGDVLDQLAACAREGKNRPVTKLTRALDSAFVSASGWPPVVLDAVMDLLRNERFLRLPSSWKLVAVVGDNWALLSRDQVERLRPILVEAFDCYADFAGAMLTAEILGERYADRRALDDLRKLARTARMPARGLVPRGLALLSGTTSDPGLRDEGLEALRAMRGDADEAVRREVELALARVGTT